MATPVAPRQILVVEDEPFVRHDLCDFFEDRGFEVLAAGNADEAIRILDTHPDISVLLTDISMPGAVDGLRLAHMVKERNPPAVVVLASGVVKPDPDQLPPGAQFFPKPINPRAILQQLA